MSRSGSKVEVGDCTTMSQLHQTRRRHGGLPVMLGRDVLIWAGLICSTLNFPASPSQQTSSSTQAILPSSLHKPNPLFRSQSSTSVVRKQGHVEKQYCPLDWRETKKMSGMRWIGVEVKFIAVDWYADESYINIIR